MSQDDEDLTPYMRDPIFAFGLSVLKALFAFATTVFLSLSTVALLTVCVKCMTRFVVIVWNMIPM